MGDLRGSAGARQTSAGRAHRDPLGASGRVLPGRGCRKARHSARYRQVTYGPGVQATGGGARSRSRGSDDVNDELLAAYLETGDESLLDGLATEDADATRARRAALSEQGMWQEPSPGLLDGIVAEIARTPQQ